MSAEAQLRAVAAHWIRQRTPGARVLHEVGLEHGQVRADLVALSEQALHGYELKSWRDTLRRLPGQVDSYSATMDWATLVVDERHAAAALPLLPAWWGVVIVRPCPGHFGSEFVEFHRPHPNPAPHPLKSARLLWRDEAWALLREVDERRVLSKLRAARRDALYERLVEVLPVAELRRHVRAAMLRRPEWKR